MLNRWKQLLRRAEWHLERAEAARAACKPIWAYLEAHQSAEKAIKALRLKHALNGHERMVARLLVSLPEHVVVPEDLFEKAEVFDSHYLPVRLAEEEQHQPRRNGKVTDEHAVQIAGEILTFVRAHLANGHAPNGHASNGHASNGHKPNGNGKHQH